MKIKSKIKFLKKLGSLFNRKEKIEFTGIMFVAFLMALFQALGVASVIPFVSLVMDPTIINENPYLSWAYSFFGFQQVRSFIIAAGLAMLAIIIIGNLISALAIWLKTRFAWRKNHQLSTALLEKYLSLPYSYFLNQNTSDLSKNVLMETKELTKSFMLPILEILIDLTIIFLIFITLILVSPVATITVLVIFALFYGIIYKSGFRRKIKTKGKKRLNENRGRFKAASEALGGIKDIKVLGREKFFINKFAAHSIKFSDLLSWNTLVGKLPRYFIEIMAFGGVVAFILVLLITGRTTGQIIPMVSFFAFAGYRIMPIMNRMAIAFTRLQFNTAVLDKIRGDLLTDRGEVKIPAEEVKNLKFKNSIELKNLSFSYPKAKEYIFKDINLKINKSTAVAIVGPTGTGKTTFVDIILGLLSPTEGELLVDGVSITRENIRSWQRNLGYVPQHIYLSDDSIKNNIAFGLPEEMIDIDRVKKAASISNLDGFIENELPNGYDTVVGERGIRLSGGQRQRVGIARALYSDPDVLVLDEATSSLDGITEESVMKAMDNVSKLKTLIIIAHRLTTVKKCDVIYLLDKGKIVATGKYDKLMKTSKQFRAMAKEL